jgi:pimeloyl-ACP methyl ester carboxylesterase
MSDPAVSVERLTIDVSDIVGAAASVAAVRYQPSEATNANDNGLLFVCLPGGTYSYRYFDLAVPGHPGYSFARDVAGRGHTVVAFDNLGTGDSSRPACEVGMDLQAAATAHAMKTIGGHERTVVGVGHSMGGYVAIFQQARFRSFDAVAILGTTNQAVRIIDLPTEFIDAAGHGAQERQRLVETLLAGFPEPYLENSRGPLLAAFHLDDVPGPVLDADLTTETVVPRLAAAQATVPGIALDAAAMIDVPVFLAFGDVDVSPCPHLEPSAYPASHDVTLFVLPESAHCHNLATSRQVLWDRLEAWATTVA